MSESIHRYLKALDHFYVTQYLHGKKKASDDELDFAFGELCQSRLNMYMTCVQETRL